MDRRKLRARVRPDASWYKITNLAGEGDQPAEVVIYDEIGYWGVTAAAFMDELKAITADRVNLRVNSVGGEVFDGIAIHNVLRAHQAHVTVYVDSLAASIASVIAMAGDRIVMQPHSQLMIHDGSGLCVGNAADMREMAELLDRQSDNIAAIYAERAGGTVRQWRERMRAETWYTDSEAVAAGLADEVAKMERQETEPALAAKWDLTVFNYAGRDAAPAPDTSRLVGERDESVSEPAPPPTPPADPSADVEAELVPVAAFDPELLRAALTDAIEKPFEFDVDDFRASLATLTSEAAAVTPQPEPVEDDADPEPAEDDDEPEEQSAGDVLAEALQALTEDAPAETTPAADEPLPDPPPPPPPPPPDEAPSIADIWREHFAPVMAAGIGIAANNAPAPPELDREPEPEPVAFDAVAFTNALKEAARG